MGFWEQATDQAGREFGARHWRWFTAARVIRRLGPAIGVLAVGVALVLGYRWLDPDWSAFGAHVAEGSSAASRWLLVTLIAAAVVALLVLLVRAGVAFVRTHGWRWLLRFRRY